MERHCLVCIETLPEPLINISWEKKTLPEPNCSHFTLFYNTQDLGGVSQTGMLASLSHANPNCLLCVLNKTKVCCLFLPINLASNLKQKSLKNPFWVCDSFCHLSSASLIRKKEKRICAINYSETKKQKVYPN